MKIVIQFDRREPPSGTIAPPSAPGEDPSATAPVKFVGWLGLMRAMYEVLGFTPPTR
jgi:hypothetical protein